MVSWSSYPGLAALNLAGTATAVVAATDVVVNTPPSPDGSFASGTIVAVGSALVSLLTMLIPVVLGFLSRKREQDRQFALQAEADEEAKSAKIGRLTQRVAFLEGQLETMEAQIKQLHGQIESMTTERGDLLRRLSSTNPITGREV